MNRAKLILMLAVTVLAAGILPFGTAAERPLPKSKFTIKQVMKEAIKGHDALVKKACKGTATPEELSRMIEYFKSLTGGTPPRGDIDSWQKKTSALLAAAERMQKEPTSKEASFQLEQAVECRQCHNAHKPAAK